MRRLLTIAVTAGFTATLTAQNPTHAPAPASAAQAEKTPAEPFTYHVDGRRDPFLSLLNSGPEPRSAARKGDGLASLTLAEIAVRGVMESRGSLVAIVAGPDNRTYIVHEGDRLFDGLIKGITREGLVVLQRITDPRSQVKQREIQKPLQSHEAAKE
jgi:Tfp pilus assembly protein PilP